jgi:hypothetical protein
VHTLQLPRLLAVVCVVALAISACSEVALAAGEDSVQKTPDWPAQAALYLYAPDISGQASLGATNVKLDLTRSDLLGGVRSGLMAYGRHKIRSHFVYAELLGFHYSQRSFQPFFDQALDGKLAFVELGAGHEYQFDNLDTRVAFYAGLRYLDLQFALQGPLIFQSAAERGVDATVGASLQRVIAGDWSLGVKVDVSGFGQSRRDYVSGAALVVYDLTPRTQLFGGWRLAHFQSSVSAAGLALDLRGQGPQIGVLYSL